MTEELLVSGTVAQDRESRRIHIITPGESAEHRVGIHLAVDAIPYLHHYLTFTRIWSSV